MNMKKLSVALGLAAMVGVLVSAQGQPRPGPEGRALRRPWQHAVKLILDEGANIEAITTQIELALTLDGKIVLNSHS